MSPRRILALGGGGFSGSVEDALLDEYVVTLAASERPRICLIPTASGDPEAQIARFYGAYEPLGCELIVLILHYRSQTFRVAGHFAKR